MENNDFSIVSITHSSNISRYQIQIDTSTFLSFIKEGGTYIFKGQCIMSNQYDLSSNFFYYKNSISQENELHHYYTNNLYFMDSEYGELEMIDECFYKFGLGTPIPGAYVTYNENESGFESGEDIITIVVEEKHKKAISTDTRFNNNEINNCYFNNNNVNLGYLNNEVIFRKTLTKDFIHYDTNDFEGYLNPDSQDLKYGIDYIKLAKNNLTSSQSETISKTFIFDANGGTCSKPTETVTTTKTTHCDGWINTLSPEKPTTINLWPGSYFNEEFYDITNGPTTMYAKGKFEYDLSNALILPTAEECTKENAVLIGWSMLRSGGLRSFNDFIFAPGTVFLHWYQDAMKTQFEAIWDNIEHFIISHKAINETEWTVEEETNLMSEYKNKISEIENYYKNLNTKYDLKVEYIPHNN